MLTTTDLSAWHTETFRVTNVAGNVLTLNSSVQHRHVGQCCIADRSMHQYLSLTLHHPFSLILGMTRIRCVRVSYPCMTVLAVLSYNSFMSASDPVTQIKYTAVII